jgi:hypothetical protein
MFRNKSQTQSDVTSKHFRPSLILASKAGVYPSGVTVNLKSRTLALFLNYKQGSKRHMVTNIL